MLEEAKTPKRIMDGLVNKQDRETVGKIATDLMMSTPETVSVKELGQDMLQDYMENLWITVERGSKDLASDFFIVVLQKKERILDNVVRNQFLYRRSCPTPTYNQSVFRYSRNDDELEYIWSLPDKDSCHMLRANALQVVSEERDMLGFVLDFFDGTLDNMAQTYNGETKKDPLAIIF
jgi:hypothetical protein